MRDHRLSIAELEAAHSCVVAGCWNDSRDRLLAAVPVLLKIAAAALAWRDRPITDDAVAPLERLLAALSKVRP